MMIDYFDVGETRHFYYIIVLNGLHIRYITVWPLMGRVYCLSKSISFNYLFHREKLISNFLIEEDRNPDSNKNFTSNRDRYVSRLLFVPLIIIVVTIFLLSMFPYIRCVIYALNSVSYFDSINALPEECPRFITEYTTLYSMFHLVKFIIDQAIIYYYMFLLFSVLKYPIVNDKFIIKTEIIGVFLIWLITYIVYNTYSLSFRFEIGVYFFRGTVRNLLITSLFIYITKIRHKISIKDFYSILHNFDLFMKNPICFSHFKDYLKTHSEEDYTYLFFWIDINSYKNFFDERGRLKNIQKANLIYTDYFMNTIRRKKTSVGKLSYRTTGSHSRSKYIDFPIDVCDTVEEAANIKFQLDNTVLYEIYDEALVYVNNRLFNRYLGMFRCEEEITEIEKLVCYIDFNIQ
jgi:hypothetical protein